VPKLNSINLKMLCNGVGKLHEGLLKCSVAKLFSTSKAASVSNHYLSTSFSFFHFFRSRTCCKFHEQNIGRYRNDILYHISVRSNIYTILILGTLYVLFFVKSSFSGKWIQIWKAVSMATMLLEYIKIANHRWKLVVTAPPVYLFDKQ
jgi:hypothetical protein